MDCRRSSKRVERVLWLMTCVGTLALAGCVTVKPHEKELLADPAMVYGSGGKPNQQEEHVLDNRAGATSSSTSAGGCGCN